MSESATCPVTLWRSTDAQLARADRCGQPVDREGLCVRHAEDRDRLMGTEYRAEQDDAEPWVQR